MIYNNVEIDSVFATCKESFAIIAPLIKRLIISYIVKAASLENKIISNSHIKIMFDNFHDKRSWIYGLKISPRHLQNKTHTARNSHNNPRPSFNFSNNPFGWSRLFRTSSIRLIKKSRQRTERYKYRFVSVCGEYGKVGCDSKRYGIGSYCSRLFVAC